MIAQEPPQERLGSVLLAQSSVVVEEAVWEEPVVSFYQNCVDVVRGAGYYVPQNPKIFAKYLVPDSTALPPPGVLVVILTSEGVNGHVAVGKQVDGKLHSVIDSVGAHEVKLALYKGFFYNKIN